MFCFLAWLGTQLAEAKRVEFVRFIEEVRVHHYRSERRCDLPALSYDAKASVVSKEHYTPSRNRRMKMWHLRSIR